MNTIHEVSGIFDDIRDEFNISKIYDKIELINKLPTHIKSSKAKMSFLETLDDNITEQDFVDMLSYQTKAEDYLNIDYIMNYYNTKYDDNYMPIFTDKFHYISLKPQAIYTYIIINKIYNHPIFSKYINMLEFSFEKRLETSLFPTIMNFKYDMEFPTRDIAIEIDEEHHRNITGRSKQNCIDAQKDALVKILGKVLFRINTTEIVDIKLIKTSIVEDITNNYNAELFITSDNGIFDIVKNSLIDNEYFTEEWCELNEVMLSSIIVLLFRRIINKKPTRELTIAKTHIEEYFNNYEEIYSHITNIISKIVYDKLNILVAEKVKNSEYLANALNELCILIFHSLLKEYNFRQKYITMVFKEDLIEDFSSSINYLKDTVDSKEIRENVIKNIIITKDIIDRFLNNSDSFNVLLNFKFRSVIEGENKRVIKSNEVIHDLLNISEVDEINTINIVIRTICKYISSISDTDMLISWSDINLILKEYNNNQYITMMLLFYYIKIDKIYESIISKIDKHNKRIISNIQDFSIYANRIIGRFNSAFDKINSLIEENDDIDSDSQCIVHDIINKVSKLHIKEQNNDKITYIDIREDDDYQKIIRTDINSRYSLLCEEFDAICSTINQTDGNSEEMVHIDTIHAGHESDDSDVEE